ncbi:MAG TPA: hypothetical protein VGC41_12900, partial [Kofleriaceae bacterium]
MIRAALVFLIACSSPRPPAPEVPESATPTVPAATPTLDAQAATEKLADPAAADHPDWMTLGAPIDRVPSATGSTKGLEDNAQLEVLASTREDGTVYKLAVDSKIAAIRPITAIADREADKNARYLVTFADPVQITVEDKAEQRGEPLARSFVLTLPPGTSVDLTRDQHVTAAFEWRNANFGAYTQAYIKDEKGLVAAIDPPTTILPYKGGKKMRSTDLEDVFEVTVKLEGRQLRSLYWSTQTIAAKPYFMFGYVSALKAEVHASDYFPGN